MNRALKVARLQMNTPSNFFAAPLGIFIVAVVVSIGVQLVIQRFTGSKPGDPGFPEVAGWNLGVVWWLVGYLAYFGVQSVSTTYPFGLALGATRRNFVLGTMISHVIQSAYLSVLMVVALGIEIATNHWFVDAYVLDSPGIGDGNPLILAVTSFIGALLTLTVGAGFATAWVRFGSKGPTFLIAGVVLIAVILLFTLAPQLGPIFAELTSAKLAAVALVITAVSYVGVWLGMRRASVR